MTTPPLPSQTPTQPIPVTLIPGDGIGPEVVDAARRRIHATGVPIAWEEAHAGASMFRKGIASGVPAETIESIQRTRLVLKGPLETPVGYGEKSANVTLRKLFETFGNIRPVREFPGVRTPYSGRGIDLVVVRENVEDLYAGIEHQQTAGVAQCLKVISRKGCEKIVRLAFEVARAQGRRSIHCATKANIMKLTEGLLKRTFEEIAPEYPDIQASHIIVDNAAHQLVKRPEQFEVLVTTNMNGDILSDLTSALVGGLGFAPSANLGSDIAIFEAVHGSAPKYAGRDVANPTAVILSAVLLLHHIGQPRAAALVENAVLATLEDGKVVPRDVAGDTDAAGTRLYTDEILRNFGRRPSTGGARQVQPIRINAVRVSPPPPPKAPEQVVGADVFVESTLPPSELGARLESAVRTLPFRLKMISNRGTVVHPPTGATTDTVDCHRCRFLATTPDRDLTTTVLAPLLAAVEAAGLKWMHVEKLNHYDGKPGYTRAQGED